MYRSIQIAIVATIMASTSFFLWRISFKYSDWAVLALFPLTLILSTSFWSLTFHPRKAILSIALRDGSNWHKWFTGKIRATFMSTAFTLGAITILAWQALRASTSEAALMLTIFFISAVSYSFLEKFLSQNVRQPFSRFLATTPVTWCLAIPATITIASAFWHFSNIPGQMVDASFQESLEIGLSQLSSREGWISKSLSAFSGYEAAKLWVAMQLRDYPAIGWLFSLDTALFSIILCQTSIVVTQFVEAHILPLHKLKPSLEDSVNDADPM